MISVAERHKHILEKLNKEGFVKVTDVAKDLDVTVVTVRKDLKIMEDKGLLYRTHGGASPINPHITDRNVVEKQQLNIEEKRKIAIAAAKLIDTNDSIIMNSGSTVCAFAEQIHAKGTLTVVTPSVSATVILSQADDINVVQLGGDLRRRSMSVMGSYTRAYLQSITCSKFFLGIDGIDIDFGVTTSNVEEAELNKAMMDVALKTIVLCDSSKFGRQGFGKICSLDKIDVIITDSGISESMAAMIEEEGVKLIIV